MATNKKLAAGGQPKTPSKGKTGNTFTPESAKAAQANGTRGLTVELVAAVRVGGTQTMFGGAEDGGSHIGSGEGAAGGKTGDGKEIIIELRATATIGGDATSFTGITFGGAEDGGSHIGSPEPESEVVPPRLTPATQDSYGLQSQNDDWNSGSLPARQGAGVKNGRSKK